MKNRGRLASRIIAVIVCMTLILAAVLQIHKNYCYC